MKVGGPMIRVAWAIILEDGEVRPTTETKEG
jgi:hypothetical protein